MRLRIVVYQDRKFCTAFTETKVESQQGGDHIKPGRKALYLDDGDPGSYPEHKTGGNHKHIDDR